MRFQDRVSRFFTRLFYGRCGFDALSSFLVRAALLPALGSLLLRGVAKGYLSLVLYLAAMTLLLWGAWRAFSRNLSARRAENEHFLSGSFYRSVGGFRARFAQRKEYAFFRCPGCKRWLRVPRGRGRLSISCPGCGARFERKT